MFLGEYQASVTSGNRIAIPKNFRKVLGDAELIVTKGYEESIVLVEKKNFETLLTGVADMPFIATAKRETSRFLLSGAHEVGADKQGRIVIPESLLKHADIASESVVFLGVGSWVEIWDQSRWEQYEAKLKKDSATIADKLSRVANSEA